MRDPAGEQKAIRVREERELGIVIPVDDEPSGGDSQASRTVAHPKDHPGVIRGVSAPDYWFAPHTRITFS